MELLNINNSNQQNNLNEPTIKMFDQNGNEMYVSKKEYRDKVLPTQISEFWNDPNNLYSLIVMSLQDGFFKEMLKPSERLFKIDDNKERCYVIRAIVLLKNDRLDDSKKVLEEYCQYYEPTGTILTNLAKVYNEKGETQESVNLLWRGLNLDPNQDNGLGWWGAIHFDKGGKVEYKKAMEKVATISGSWRAQLFLAKLWLEDKDINNALELYREVLSKASNESGALLDISGELGKNGLYQDTFDLIVPLYKIDFHDPFIGINLLQTYLEANRYKEGITLLLKLKKLNRYDINKYLDYFQDKFEELL